MYACVYIHTQNFGLYVYFSQKSLMIKKCGFINLEFSFEN